MTYSVNQAPVEMAAIDRFPKSNSWIASLEEGPLTNAIDTDAILLFDFESLSSAAISTGAWFSEYVINYRN